MKPLLIAALCAALFSVNTLANKMLAPFPNSELNCSVNGSNIILELKTTTTVEPIKVSLMSGQGNSMMSQVSGQSNNRFQMPAASLPATLSLSNNAKTLKYQIFMQDESCLIVENR